MKWPCVSRARFDAYVMWAERTDALYETRIADLKAHIAQQDHNLEKMREMYHALKVTGASAPTIGLMPEAKSRLAADVAIEDQVEARGGGDRLRRVLRRYVNMERQKSDANEDAIAERVRKWADPDEDAA